MKQKKIKSEEQKISVVMVIYNEGDKIRKCLESVKGIVDEILVMHDGPCSDNTIKICKEYTKKIVVNKNNVGLPGPILPLLVEKAKGPWILKIDADEFLSPELKRDIKRLAQNPKADAYIFKWLYRADGKYITKNWPTKTVLYRKSKISLFGFPHRDDPIIHGNIIETSYSLEHRPPREGMPTWKEFKNKYIGRYARLQAEWTLKDFDKLNKFQWHEKDFSIAIKIRRRFPLLSSVPMGILAFFKSLFSEGAWREGFPALWLATSCLIYYPYVGYYIYKLKKEKQVV